MYSSWIKYFGTPIKFLADNGGEFTKEKFKEINKKLNIEVCHTAAESPLSNDVVERRLRGGLERGSTQNTSGYEMRS